MSDREPKLIDCPSCGKKRVCTPAKRGPFPKRCDRCRERGTPPTECAVCNVELPPATGRGRPRMTCSEPCASKLRNLRAKSPERELKRWEYTTKRARRESGQPEVLSCKVCGEAVDSGKRGPKGCLETGFAVHNALGTDPSGEFRNCKERYEAGRLAQRKQGGTQS
jgi:hypothetical protein